MIPLNDLREATGGQLFGEASADHFTGFCHDPRLVKPGDLYVALRTEAGDGHPLIEQALAAGATGVMCQEHPACDVTNATVILVGDTFASLGQWATYALRQYRTTVVGVAGLVGKSSACEAIATVLGTHHTVYRGHETTPGVHGLLLGLGRLTPECRIAIIEYDCKYPGEMVSLLAFVQPQVTVITNVDPGEVASQGNCARVRLEAEQVLEALPEDGTAILNGDDNRLLELRSFSRASLLVYGQGTKERVVSADLLADNIRFNLDRTVFDLHRGKRTLRECQIPVLGRSGLYAVLAALAVGLVFEVPLEEGLRALSALRALPGHLRLLDGVRDTLLVDDTFDAAPVAALDALEWLSAVDTGNGRRFFVVGDLAGQGEETLQAHLDVGQSAAHSTDFLIACGEMACVAAREARRSGMTSERALLFYNQDDATDAVLSLASSSGDVVLMAGGRRAHMERVGQRLLRNPVDRARLSRQQADSMETAVSRPEWPSWIELDLRAVAHNARELKRLVGSEAGLMAVVEGDAYGHGAIQIASTAMNSGAAMLAVGSLAEGIELRRAGIEAPTLILGHVPPWGAQQAIAQDLLVSIHDFEEMHDVAQAARVLNRVAKVHVCVDVGLGYSGVLPDQAVPLVRELVKMESLEVDGLYTHLSLLENDISTNAMREPLAKFAVICNSLYAAGLVIPRVHVASISALTMPESGFTMARCGLAIVGLDFPLRDQYAVTFRRVLSWKTTVSQVKTMPSAERVAIIPVGYADGFNSSSVNPAEVLIRGRRASVMGRPFVNRSMIYVSPLPNTQPGDEVVLIGHQGDDEIGVEEIARRLRIAVPEIVCAISARIPRIVI